MAGGEIFGDVFGAVGDQFARDPYGTTTSYQQFFGGSPGGTGRAAARGFAQGGARNAARMFALQQQQERANRAYDLAYGAFERTNPFEAGFAVTLPGVGELGNPSPKLARLVAKNRAKLVQLQAKQQTSKVIAKEKKITAQIALRTARQEPTPDVRVSTLTGPNAGYWRERGAPPPLWLTQTRVSRRSVPL